MVTQAWLAGSVIEDLQAEIFYQKSMALLGWLDARQEEGLGEQNLPGKGPLGGLGVDLDPFSRPVDVDGEGDGDPNCPSSYVSKGTSPPLNLGAWLVTQRQAKKGNGSGKLSDERIRRLGELGVRWDKASWDEHFAALERYAMARDSCLCFHRYIQVPNTRRLDGRNSLNESDEKTHLCPRVLRWPSS